MKIIQVDTDVCLSVYDEKYAGDIIYHTLGATDYGYFHSETDGIGWAVPACVIKSIQSELLGREQAFDAIDVRRRTAVRELEAKELITTSLREQLDEARKPKKADPDTLIKLAETDMSTESMLSLFHAGAI